MQALLIFNLRVRRAGIWWEDSIVDLLVTLIRQETHGLAAKQLCAAVGCWNLLESAGTFAFCLAKLGVVTTHKSRESKISVYLSISQYADHLSIDSYIS